MSDELKPCPFCGEKATKPETMIDGCVCCSNPDCVAWTFPSTIKQWQTRPIEDALRAELGALKERTGWIPVGEQRPPEDETRYTARTFKGATYWTWLPEPPEVE